MGADAPPRAKVAWPDGWQIFWGIIREAAFSRMSDLAPESTSKKPPSATPLLEEKKGASTEEIELQAQSLSIEVWNINSAAAQISGVATK